MSEYERLLDAAKSIVRHLEDAPEEVRAELENHQTTMYFREDKLEHLTDLFVWLYKKVYAPDTQKEQEP